MDPEQIRQREYWGLGTLVLAAIYLIVSLGNWLLAGGSFSLIGFGVLLGATGAFIIATLPDSQDPDSKSY